MKTILMVIGLVAVIGVGCYVGCSKENREEAMNRITQTGKSLSGESRPDDVEHGVPNIVADQQRKERIRQNTTWTAENQALHPVEYCQAKLADIEEYSKRLEVATHKMKVAKSGANREIADNEAKINSYTKFLAEAKKAYKEAEAAGSDHVMLGGFNITLQKAKLKMVDAYHNIPYLKERIAKRKNMINQLDKNLAVIEAEQIRLVEMRERIQHTISDLQLDDVIKGEQGIRDALGAINDSMESLGVDYDDPSIETIVQPSSAEMIDAEFDKLMSE